MRFLFGLFFFFFFSPIAFHPSCFRRRSSGRSSTTAAFYENYYLNKHRRINQYFIKKLWPEEIKLWHVCLFVFAFSNLIKNVILPSINSTSINLYYSRFHRLHSFLSGQSGDYFKKSRNGQSVGNDCTVQFVSLGSVFDWKFRTFHVSKWFYLNSSELSHLKN